jgi:Fe-S cluster assembly protein SufB
VNKTNSILLNENYKKKYGFSVPEKIVFKGKKGLTRETIEEISKIKKEPKWMLRFRLKSFKIFQKKELPEWAPNLNEIDFNKIIYYLKPFEKKVNSWEKVPREIKQTFERLGVPEAEKRFLAGLGAQFESETVYHKIKKSLEKQGVIFLDTDTALKEHEEIFKEFFATVVPPDDNKFAALNSAVWSGGSFVFIPKNVKVSMPLQAYFRINAQNVGQFERTLIIAEKNSKAHYIEGCTAPMYSTASLHAAVVEVIVKENAVIRYTTIQNWSNNVFNLVTKRAVAFKNAVVEWVDGNIGSRLTMKYPSVLLKGENSKASILSVAFAGKNQVQDAGARVIHLASNTQSKIVSKSVSKENGRTTFRGLVKVTKNAKNVCSAVQCDALLLDEKSENQTFPLMKIAEDSAVISHEASVGKISENELFYLMSRGLTEAEAKSLIVLGFINQFTRELPMEYAVELNRLIQMEMENSIA